MCVSSLRTIKNAIAVELLSLTIDNNTMKELTIDNKTIRLGCIRT